MKRAEPLSMIAINDGTGLGLAIAREIARNVGGNVEFVGDGQAGACFRLQLRIDGTTDGV